MTEKRFTYEYDEYDGNLFDNKMNTFYHIEDSDENIEVLCDRLNWLVEENEQLQKKNDNLVNMIARVQYRADLIKEENEQLKKVFRELITSGYWDDNYLTEQDWNDLKRYIENVFEKVMMNG